MTAPPRHATPSFFFPRPPPHHVCVRLLEAQHAAPQQRRALLLDSTIDLPYSSRIPFKSAPHRNPMSHRAFPYHCLISLRATRQPPAKCLLKFSKEPPLLFMLPLRRVNYLANYSLEILDDPSAVALMEDADLIMLALAIHEVHFSIPREGSRISASCVVKWAIWQLTAKEMRKENLGNLMRKFVHIWTLREYLGYEFRIPNPPFEIDFERIVDDFIFMCFFIGSDFLPHMPTLEIREGAINLLMAVYKKEFRAMAGYLTDGCTPNMSRVEHFIQAVGAYEYRIFQKRVCLHQIFGDNCQKPQVFQSTLMLKRFQ